MELTPSFFLTTILAEVMPKSPRTSCELCYRLCIPFITVYTKNNERKDTQKNSLIQLSYQPHMIECE